MEPEEAVPVDEGVAVVAQETAARRSKPKSSREHTRLQGSILLLN